MVPVSWPVQKPQTRPRRSFSRCWLNTRASSMMQALPAALSVACGPNQESWWPPTTTKSSLLPLISPTVICSGRQPFSTLARNQTRTGPDPSISRNLSPAVRAMPMQGSVAISDLNVSGVGLPHTGLTEPNGTAVFSAWPQFIITQPVEPMSAAMRCFS